jgi:endogenous inhibitor of DNA gyrase (YacG/DUF329 family)
MTPDEKSRLTDLRKAGRSYTEIADALGISKNTVKTFCRRNGLAPEVESTPVEVTPAPTTERLCPHCGKPVIQPQGRKEKKFCSDTCRNRWWNSHMDLVNRKAIYEYTCPTCGTAFTAYGNNHRKYCCHECYIADRFGGRT